MTKTLRVGTLVFANDFRHPAVLAKEAATLDLLSDGRLEVGVGAGWMTDDYATIEENPQIRVRFPNDVDGSKLNRFLPLIKWLLAVPLYVVGVLYAIWAILHFFFSWTWIVFTGSMRAR